MIEGVSGFIIRLTDSRDAQAKATYQQLLMMLESLQGVPGLDITSVAHEDVAKELARLTQLNAAERTIPVLEILTFLTKSRLPHIAQRETIILLEHLQTVNIDTFCDRCIGQNCNHGVVPWRMARQSDADAHVLGHWHLNVSQILRYQAVLGDCGRRRRIVAILAEVCDYIRKQ